MPYPYATTAAVKARLGITNTTHDSLLSGMCEAVNALVESIAQRALGSSTVTAEKLDGWDTLEGGRVIVYPRGVRSISSLEVAAYTGSTYVTVPSTDYFLRPTANLRTPGWPAFEIWMTDIPAAANSLPTFEGGFDTIRMTADIGWAQMPVDVREVAEVTVVRAWQARQAGQTDEAGTDENGTVTVSRHLSARDMQTLMRYRWRSIEIV